VPLAPSSSPLSLKKTTQAAWYTEADGDKRGVLIGYHYFEDDIGRENLKFFLEVYNHYHYLSAFPAVLHCSSLI
jgi:hypothetical protein